MRVITGISRGIRLKTPDNLNTRPTSEKVKEAVFSALQFEIEGRRVLDLFAGSGQMGIEALSRGAKSCVFVDSSQEAVKIVEENLKKTGLSIKARVVKTDSSAFLNMSGDTYDIVFLDPPYNTGLLENSLEKIGQFLATGGVVVCEHPFGAVLPPEINHLVKDREYKYGKIAVTIYRKE
ncbi:MAG: 16S rRNA (guanine(966)-N(2))-methyltransferase RsmD [Clostridiales bacterium]|nr:16S rRNA (guanine(966)-N(2))-methyltransferase RsmD [Clostridiales bacterium]